MKRSDHDYTKARKLRQEMSLPERLLWKELRARRGGVKLRRQHPVGPYVIDFYCAAAKTGFAIDGISHDMGDSPAADAQRDTFLSSRGIAIERIAAGGVLRDPPAVAESIVAICLGRSRWPLRPPLRSGHLPIRSERGGTAAALFFEAVRLRKAEGPPAGAP